MFILKTKQNEVNTFLMKIMIFFSLFNGVINSLMAGQRRVGTIITDVVVMMFIVFQIVILVQRKTFSLSSKAVSIVVMYLIAFIYSIFLFITQHNDINQRLVGYRNMFFYSICFFLVLINGVDLWEMAHSINFWGTVLCIYSIIQFLFVKSLPYIFLAGVDDYYFYVGNGIFRVNGLIGTTIDFGLCTCIVCCMSLCCYYVEADKKYLICIVIEGVSNMLTFGRMSILMMLICISIFWVTCNYKKISIRLVAFVIMLVTLISISLVFFSDRFLVMRFLSADETSQLSNNGHIEMFLRAFELINKKKYFGYGFGIHSDYSIGIGDGYWLTVMIEAGVIMCAFVAILYIYLLIYFITYIKKNRVIGTERLIPLTGIILLLLVMISGCINSAFLNKTNSIIWWLCVACAIRFTVMHKKNIER